MRTTATNSVPTSAHLWATAVTFQGSETDRPDGTGTTAIGFDSDGRMINLAALNEQRLRPDLPSEFRSNLVGGSQALHDVKALISKVAPTDAKVLITGETGTGKELVATDIYAHSSRAGKPFITVNCAAIPESLISSVLFGHEKGAFTSADKRTDGIFKAADGGTIFLDEIGELDKGLQAKLLRVIEIGTFRRVGGEEDISVNVRVVAATNRNIDEALKSGKISRGLYDRLSTIHIHVPPLRDHIDDVPVIAVSLLEKHRNFVPDKIATVIAADAMDVLEDYNWPGNVRQLENVIRRAIIFSKGGIIKKNDIAFTSEEAGLKILEKFEDVSLSSATVLISGEPGVGKELTTKLIYDSSRRSQRNTVIVDCASITDSIAESELFGHVSGAFTGAINHKGYFEQANEGTLVLDEIGALPLNIQAKLLRALQQGEIVVVGTKSPIKIDTRVIATSSQDLAKAVQEGRFREDLYHRLSVLPLTIPPLRERKDEIPQLVERFITELGKQKQITEISSNALSKLCEYDFPGNIRQLKAVIERAIILADEGSPLDTQHIVFDDFEVAKPLEANQEPAPVPVNTVQTRTAYPNEPEDLLLRSCHKELVDFAISDEKSDLFDFKLRFLVLKYKIAKRIVESKPVTDREIQTACGVSSNTARRLCLRFNQGTTVEMVRKLEEKRAAYKLLSDGCVLPGGISLSENTSRETSEIPTNPVLLKHLKELTDFAKKDEPTDNDKLRFLFAKYRMAKLVHDRRIMNATDTAKELGYNQVTLQKILEPYGYKQVRDLRDELSGEFQC